MCRFLGGTKLFSGSDKTKIFTNMVPFTLHLLVALMQNSTTAKEKDKWPSQFPLKMEHQS